MLGQILRGGLTYSHSNRDVWGADGEIAEGYEFICVLESDLEIRSNDFKCGDFGDWAGWQMGDFDSDFDIRSPVRPGEVFWCLFVGDEYLAGIRKADTYEDPNSSLPLLPFHQAHRSAPEYTPVTILRSYVHCDLVAVGHFLYNCDFTICLLPSSQYIYCTRVQWNAERRELNRRVPWRWTVTAPNATDDVPIFRLGMSHLSAWLGKERPLQKSSRVNVVTCPTYIVRKDVDRKYEEPDDGNHCNVGAKCDEKCLGKSSCGMFRPSLWGYGWWWWVGVVQGGG